MSDMVDRRLGWVTVDGQEYPREQAADWVEAVERGLCPFCGAGPFLVVAIHVWKRHGLDRFEFRDLLGVTYRTSVCHPDHRKRVQARSRDLFERGVTLQARDPHAPRRLSQAAKELNRQKAKAITPEQRKKNGEAVSAARIAAAAERDARIKQLYDEGKTLTQIAREVGVNSVTVKEVGRRQGWYEGDGRARYHGSRKGIYSDSLQAGTAAQRAKNQARAERILGGYKAGLTIDQLVDQEGGSAKSMRAYLKKLGADVPDGRSARPTPMTAFHCACCGDWTEKPTREIRSNRRMWPDAPLVCSRSCAAKLRYERNGGIG